MDSKHPIFLKQDSRPSCALVVVRGKTPSQTKEDVPRHFSTIIKRAQFVAKMWRRADETNLLVVVLVQLNMDGS